MIDVKNLSKSFGGKLVLDDISEHIYPGEKVVIIFTWLLGILERRLRASDRR